jgi:hypothetical protein
MEMNGTSSLDAKAKADAFDILVEGRREVLRTAGAWSSGGSGNVIAGLEAFSKSAREFAALAERLCDKEISGTLARTSRATSELALDRDYWMIGEYENMPVMSVCRLYGDSDDPGTVRGDEDGNVYVFIDGPDGWEASGYVKREDLASTEELLEALRVYRSRD